MAEELVPTDPHRRAIVVNLADYRAARTQPAEAPGAALPASFRMSPVRIGPNHRQIAHRRRMLSHLTARTGGGEAWR
ncbi:MAG: hypothetical protein IT183_00530 [Acidobacteria bacterium]|nr:hypothetical protein [Acidobacteriota bacterium]